MTISQEDIKKIAHLARINISSDESIIGEKIDRNHGIN